MPAQLSNGAVVSSLIYLVFGVLMGVYAAFCVLPALRAQRSRSLAQALAIGLTLLGALALGLTALLRLPVFLSIVILVWFAAMNTRFLIWATGGPAELDPLQARVAEILADADARRNAGDAAGWQAALDELQVLRGEGVTALVAAFDAYRDELSRGAPATTATLERIHAATRHLFGTPRPTPRWQVVGMVVLGGVLATSPVLAGPVLNPNPCERASAILRRTSPGHDLSTKPPLTGLLVASLPDQFQGALAAESALDLRDAADTRFDPDTLRQLRSDQFTRGYERAWRLADGTQASSDVFEFITASGAVDYHDSVAHYACEFADETFETDAAGIGMQIRYAHGDPIAEQIAWIVGPRRFVVAVTFRQPPADHSLVEALFRAQMERIGSVDR
jgi:hypothetical protein